MIHYLIFLLVLASPLKGCVPTHTRVALGNYFLSFVMPY